MKAINETIPATKKSSKITQFLLKLIFDLCYYLDKKLFYLKEYDYETAPYCGHHYNGHSGKLTGSDYWEGNGKKYCQFLYWVIVIDTEERFWYMQNRNIFNKQRN